MVADDRKTRRVDRVMALNGVLPIAGGLVALVICLGQNAPWYGYATPVLFLGGGAGLLVWRPHYRYPFGRKAPEAAATCIATSPD